ncbi:hypothetical protein AB8O64_24210 [Streptomyces sp. QH1-20]|uniref:hypothetical protein n=1 Tax=Streptomyces sp. QH1-20 TaxID=3240934 RepID=UPI0035121C85
MNAANNPSARPASAARGGELDVDRVRQTIAAALAPLPVGDRLDPAVVTTTAQRPAEYAQALLPQAAAAHGTRRSSRGRVLPDTG